MTQLNINKINGISYAKDSIKTLKNSKIDITFIQHASLMIEFEGKIIFIDPTGEFADYSKFPKADFLLFTHSHSDHFDIEAVGILNKENTRIICNQEVAGILKQKQELRISAVSNGDFIKLADNFTVEAFPAHNYPERQHFHPHGRDNGYLLTLDGMKIYVSGDTEDIKELALLGEKSIDIAFLPVNQPYTMTIEQANKAVRMIKPKIFYPYHYGQTDKITDIDELKELLQNSGIEVRIRSME